MILTFSVVHSVFTLLHDKFQWDHPHVMPADMSVEVSELFTRELTRVRPLYITEHTKSYS